MIVYNVEVDDSQDWIKIAEDRSKNNRIWESKKGQETLGRRDHSRLRYTPDILRRGGGWRGTAAGYSDISNSP